MANFEQALESIKSRYYELKSRSLVTISDYVVAKNNYMDLCSQAINLLDEVLETPSDHAFVGDEGIK